MSGDVIPDEIEAVLAAAVQWKSCRVAACEAATTNKPGRHWDHLSQAEAALSAAVTAYAKKHIYPEGEPR